ncbi:hypothetical protein GCM10022252_65080 [Streptosporangium oxazolinicum]|uniref:MarR family transcriptional regulator n=1 Tax=Streptosporangium oxazolinicum TaxID=909287 RepID=A0ABP8BFZ9_9ACTN
MIGDCNGHHRHKSAPYRPDPLDRAGRKRLRNGAETATPVREAALTDHAATLKCLLSGLAPEDAATLARILRTMLDAVA